VLRRQCFVTLVCRRCAQIRLCAAQVLASFLNFELSGPASHATPDRAAATAEVLGEARISVERLKDVLAYRVTTNDLTRNVERIGATLSHSRVRCLLANHCCSFVFDQCVQLWPQGFRANKILLRTYGLRAVSARVRAIQQLTVYFI
jgi:hypothetical protein